MEITEKNQNSLINYLCEISADTENNLFVLKWNNSVVVKDCDNDGRLINVTRSRSNPWIRLTAKPFYDDKMYCIFSCEKCCPDILNLNLQQKHQSFKSLLCHHSKVVSELVNQEIFNFPSSLHDLQKYRVEAKEDDLDILQEKTDSSTKSQWLIAIYLDHKISFLFTTGRQTRPRCSKCKTESCKCLIFYKRKKKEGKTEEVPANLARTDSVESQADSPDFDENEKPAHYEDRDANYGFNFTRIKYPLIRDPDQNKMKITRERDDFSLPAELIPAFNDQLRCKHGLTYNEDDRSLRLCAPQVTLYETSGEKTFNCRVYFRPTSGPCKCRQYYDGHEYLMYHVAEGKMICYFALQFYLHSWVNSGTSCYSAYKTMKMNAVSNGKPCSLTYQNWLKACDGFVSLLDVDKNEAFSCPTCGIAPKFYVGDGIP